MKTCKIHDMDCRSIQKRGAEGAYRYRFLSHRRRPLACRHDGEEVDHATQKLGEALRKQGQLSGHYYQLSLKPNVGENIRIVQRKSEPAKRH